jgi:hypothetical protein
MDNTDFIFPFTYENLITYFKNGSQGGGEEDYPQVNYLFYYLEYLNAKTCILEKEYIDKDYLIDYQKFYCRSFEKYERFTKRIHFLSEDVSQDNF